MSQPRIFISAASQELGSVRLMVRDTVRLLGFEPVSQDDFPTGHGELLAWLRAQIEGCEGVIQIAGAAYGAEPPRVDPEYGRVSYTQFELCYALKRRKKTWLIVAGDHCRRDRPLAELDVPPEGSPENPAAYQEERRQLQREYLERMRRENHLWHDADDDKDIKLLVQGLNDQLGRLRRRSETQQRRLTAAIGALLVGLGVLGGGGWWAYERLHVEVQNEGQLTTAKIKAHLLETVEVTHQKELAAADLMADWKERQTRRAEAEAANKARLERIDELAASFVEIEGQGSATGVFQEMTRILSTQGVDAAIEYVAGQREAILAAIRARAAAASQRNRSELQPLLKAAGLYEGKGDGVKARALYQEILAAEPNWPDALHAGFWYFTHQGDAAVSRTTLAEAQRDFAQAEGLAQRLVTQDGGSTLWRRDLSVSHERMGTLAMNQGKLGEAAREYEESLAIARKLTASDPGNAQWQGDLSSLLDRVGNVTVSQGKLDEALRSYQESLAIRLRLAANDQANTQWQSDLLISYDKLCEVAVSQGKLEEAVRNCSAGMAIVRKLAAGEPGNVRWQRDLSIYLERLGDLAVSQDKLDDAASNYSEGLGIARKLAASDPDNMERQRDLSIAYQMVGDLAMSRGETADAALDYGQVMEIAGKLAARDPGNTDLQRDLYFAYHKQGDVAASQGKLDEAARDWADGLTIAQKLSASDPSNTQWQDDVSVFYDRRGDIALKQGNLNEAAVFYGQSLTIRKKLAASDPGNAEWQRGVWVSDTRLAEVAVKRGQPQEARRYWQEAFTILNDMKQRGVHISAADLKLLDEIAQKLGFPATTQGR